MPFSAMFSSYSRAAGLVLLASFLASAQFSAADEPAEKPAAPAAEVEKNDAKWDSLFDGKTLEGWKATEFGTGGEVLVQDGHIVVSFGDGCTGVTWQKDFPKVDYEVRLEAQRVEGTDFFCGLTFPVKDSHCSLIVGGWGGAVVGLSTIDGEDAARNKTSQYMTFKKGQWYKVRVRVTQTRIVVWIDEKQIIDQDTTTHKISIRPEVAKSKPFGVASWSTTAALRKIEVRKLTAEESQPAKVPEADKK